MNSSLKAFLSLLFCAFSGGISTAGENARSTSAEPSGGGGAARKCTTRPSPTSRFVCTSATSFSAASRQETGYANSRSAVAPLGQSFPSSIAFHFSDVGGQWNGLNT